MRPLQYMIFTVAAFAVAAAGCSGAKKSDNTTQAGMSAAPAGMEGMDSPEPMARPADMPPAMAMESPVTRAAMAKPAARCLSHSNCLVKRCCCGWDVRLAGAETPLRCRRKCKCRPNSPPRPTPICHAGACYAARSAPVCKTKADCNVQSCRCGWIVWSKKSTKPSLCNARVNCAGHAQKAPKPTFDCVNQRCVKK